MKAPSESEIIKYFFLPSQIIDFDEYIILRKGIVQLKITGESSREIIKVIMTLASEDGATISEILNYFDGAYQEAIEQIVTQLIHKRFMVNEKEKILYTSAVNEEPGFKNFHWAMNIKEDQLEKVKHSRIYLLGVNHISIQMCELLKKSGFEKCLLIDYPLLRNLYFFNDEGIDKEKFTGDPSKVISYNKWIEALEEDEFDMLVATSDFGGTYYMRDFNTLCVENKLPFFAVALQNLKAFIGPLVIPGYTACYECFLQRQNSNQEDYDVLRSIELSDYEGQSVNAFHPAMAFTAADIAAMEIFKFITGVTGVQNTGRVIELNLLKTEMKNKLVLKVPRCSVCSAVHKNSATTSLDNAFMLTHYE